MLALAMSVAANASAPASPNEREPTEATYVKVTAKVFVTEAGIPKTVEILSVEPPLSPATEADFASTTKSALLTWTFRPNQENGRPVAGYVIAPVMIDISDNIPIRRP